MGGQVRRPYSVRLALVTVLLAAVPLASSCGEGTGQGSEFTVPGATSPPSASQPNIVVVMTDDQDLQSLRVMNAVKGLARAGTTFANFQVTFPLCCPSRATLLAGQYAHNHGVLSNKPPEGGFPAFRGQERTLGVWLQSAGYRTAWIGKYLNAYGVGGDYPIPPGWSDWRVPVEFSELRMYDFQLNENGEIHHYGTGPRDYQTDVLTRKAVRFIQAGDDEPFFLGLAPLAPHDEDDTIDTGARDPRPAPRDFGVFEDADLPRPPAFNEADVADKPRAIRRTPPLDRAQLEGLELLYRSRLESLLAVDDAVGRIVGALRRAGELENTVIFFTSDNGYLLGEHRQVGGKDLPYDEATHVPLIVRGPGFAAGTRLKGLTGNVDLAPTILDLAEAEPTRVLDGLSLLGGDTDESGGRALVIESDSSSGVRTGHWLYVEYAGGDIELYDLVNDPFELDSLDADPRYLEVRRSLAEILDRLRDCAGEECRQPIDEPPAP